MPLQALKFNPGVSRNSTTLSNEGTWFECDKVRFRGGLPEKLGGWVKDNGVAATGVTPPAGSFWGVCRSLWNWITLDGSNLLSVATHLKLYIQDTIDGDFYDVTPIRSTTTNTATFAATSGSSVITVTDAGHGAQTGDFVTFSGAVSLGGNVTADILNAEHQITYVSSSVYTITVSVTADGSDTGNGGGAVTSEYELTTGNEFFSTASGFGAGGWGGATTGFTSTGWGQAAATGVGVDMRLWSQINFGEFLIANVRGGGIYLWVPASAASTYYRAQVLSSTNTNTQEGTAYWTTDTSCPSKCNIVHVSDSSRFVIAFGCNDYGESDINPLLVRWSDQEDYATWAPSVTNQAGSFTLSSGSEIIAIKPQRQEILVFTDAALYSMQYLGAPFVWGFQQVGSNTSIIGPNAVTTAANLTFWMGIDKFYVYDGRVQTLPCPLWQYVFNNINRDQGYQIFASTNEGFDEIWWFYCSDGATEVDRYVVFNYADKIWYYGTLSRTAWLDTPLRNTPVAAGYNGQIIYHEQGVDDATTNPPTAINSYIQSADFDLADGYQFQYGWRMIPDVKFDGSTVAAPEVTFSLTPRQYPGSGYGTAVTGDVVSANNYTSTRQYTVQQFTTDLPIRIRGRQMAFKVSSDTVGTHWQLGVPRINLKQDGRR